MKKNLYVRIYHGVWIDPDNKLISPYSVIPYLFAGNRVYVSFISALHIYGIIEQIPQVITVASLNHSKIIRTGIATYEIHKIIPSFFCGFDWYKQKSNFLIAEPEKALIDSLYISTKRTRQFSFFPELHFPDSFNFKKAENWIDNIQDTKIRRAVRRKCEELDLSAS